MTAEIGKLEAEGFFAPVEQTVCGGDRLEKLLNDRYRAPWNKLELSLSERCNLACRYCYCGTCRDVIPNRGLMPEAIARKAVEWLFAHSGRDDLRITFFGGEPLLNLRAMKSAIQLSQRLADERGVKVTYSTTTNGTLLDDESIGLIKRYDFGLMVSLDGPKSLHDAQCPMRDGRGSWELATAGIKRLMARRRRVTVRCTMAHPIPDMMALIRYYEDFGFTRIVLGAVSNPIFPSPCDFTEADYADEERQLAEKVIPWMLSEFAVGRTPRYDPFANLESEQSAPEARDASPLRCGACHGTMTVGSDGTLYPCHRFVGMDRWAVGHLDHGPDIDRCRQFWRDYCTCIQDRCAKCWAYRLCGGPCPWSVARADGAFAMNESVCEETRRWIRLGAWYLSMKQQQREEEGKK